MRYDFVVFDFDGTLCDSGEGILKSARYALESFGIVVDADADMRFFVGPPLIDSFQRYEGVDEKKAEAMVEKYRERYRETGLFESRVYPGVEALLQTLHAHGVKIGIGSSKPLLFIERIVEHFGLRQYFDCLSAIDMKNAREPKSEIISRCLAEMGCSDRRRALMVGDRYFDIEGANGAGIDSAGVLYGYGTRAEFEAHGARYIVSSAQKLEQIILE